MARWVKILISSRRNPLLARHEPRGSASSQTKEPASSRASSLKARPRKAPSALLARIGTGALLPSAILTSRNTRFSLSKVKKAPTPVVVMSMEWRSWNFR